ncbi:MAG: hypothetical protein PF638_13620 [Candidatus Delongbacteria bacterium]|jgi:hypothetical protein|nr:hypothetical protein [Candidatus Delongbacteria bacterium]
MFKNQSKLLIVVLLLVAFGLIAQKNGLIEKKYVIDENGDQLVMTKIAGYPPAVLPEKNKDLPSKDAKLPGEIFWLDNVPAYDWSYGCTATATAIVSGYYDNTGVVNAYTGGITSVNGGLAPMSNVIWDGQSSQPGTAQIAMAATKQGVDGRDKRGHGDDYWVDYEVEDDPYYGLWTEHAYSEAGYNHSTADYMGTNQWYNWESMDGSTTFWNYGNGARMYDKPDETDPPSRDGAHGLKLYWEAKGYTVDWNYNQHFLGYNDATDDPDLGPTTLGFTFEDYMAQIDKGYPVLIHVVGHSMTGYGYDNTGTNQTVYLMDTWDRTNTPGAHTMEWGTSYSGMAATGVTVVEIGTECGWFAPRNVFALNDNRSVTVTWDDPSKGTVANIEYILFRDGAQIASGLTTESYVDVYPGDGSNDGMHYYRLKSYYPSDSYTTIISGDEAAVYVSPSVTEFYDDFEDGNGDWLMSPTWGSTHAWGNDTDANFVYAGGRSLSDSPLSETYNTDSANGFDVPGFYGDATDQLTTGGSIAEVAPGLDFSLASDAKCTFQLKYLIEESFDYLHFQACKDGLTWVTLRTWSSESYTTWNLETIGLGLFAGEANVRFRFILVTDPGYATEGANIDEFRITPFFTDEAAPYVYYDKAEDYYDSNPNGFEITTDITDYTGISYANVLYSVNGGGEITLAPASVVGDEYNYEIPAQNPGDYVEFRFDCEDTSSSSNQSYTGPFFYQAGLHQRYDNGFVSFFTEIHNVAAPDPEYPTTEIICTRFTSFYEDLMGVVIRGYDDASQTEDNSDMIIHVYADDNGGMPGTELITPFAVTNPATLSNTNKWAYVDLSSYGLTGMTEFFIGIGSDNNVTGDLTRSVTSSSTDPGIYDFGRAYSKSIPAAGSAPAVWIKEDGTNYHMRAVTTNYDLSPPIINPNPGALLETVAPNGSAAGTLGVGNDGGFDLDYNATFEYTSIPAKDVKATLTPHSNDFESGLVYTNSGAILFATATGGTWNSSTTCASAVSKQTGNGSSSAIMTSGTFDGSVCSSLNLDFDYSFTTAGLSNVNVEVYNGTAWASVFTASTTGSGNEHIALPTVAAGMQLRITTSLRNKTTDNFGIDNIVISGPEVINVDWLRIDGGLTTSGTVTPAGNDNIAIAYDATGLTVIGDYKAIIHLTGNSADPIDVNVTMTIEAGGNPPAQPANVVTSISGTDLVIDWDVSADATGYDVYSSDDPYGTFTLATSVGTNQYTVPASQAKLFYYIIATNAVKSTPRVTIKKNIVK